MEDKNEETLSAEEVLLQKHRKERKELQAQVQKMKHSVPKGDKKKKKEVTAEIAKLEAELDAKQEQELTELKSSNEQVRVTAEQLDTLSTGETDEKQPKKPSKAQKRKDKKAQKEKEREQRIAEQDIENLSGARHLEAVKLKDMLKKRNLKIFEIPSDGNCLYCAIEDQLRPQGIQTSVESLRQQTANFMRSHEDDFLPFLTKTDTGDPYSAEEYEEYCTELESTPAWGGQLEIRALSDVLRIPIEVIQADAPPLIVGEEYATKTITLTYHRHHYGLGEHYNSVRERTGEEESEEET